jgi:uncharacterized membrane protein
MERRRRPAHEVYHQCMRDKLDRRLLTFGALLLASVGCLALLYGRRRLGGSSGLDFLAWNLVLAWVPFLVSLVLYDVHRRGSGRVALIALGSIWLVFLPNAPYIITDFIHVGESLAVPVWYDAATIASFAGLGLALGFGSLFLVQHVVRSTLGTAAAWTGVVATLGLCSAGIYLGRVVRLNSWDVLVNPEAVGRAISTGLLDPYEHMHVFAGLVGLTGALLLAYVVLYTLSAIAPRP